MPHKDPEERRMYHRELMRKLRQDTEYRERMNARKRHLRAKEPWRNLGRTHWGNRKAVPLPIRRAVYLRAKGECEKKDSHVCKGSLGIHHIDGDPRNNELSNLLLVCASYHAKDHGFGTDISGRPSPSS